MELVLGLPITEYCDARHLPTRERLLLICDVCRAVQHAHQKGVIHRDLKPSNVLVTVNDGAAVVKVIDFGVAKALDQSLTATTYLTQFSQLIGTPLYMSPEQAELTTQDVDTRSDVYSLGVLLYELLTGHTPFDRESLKEVSFDELRRIIREDEPPTPSSRLSTLNAEAASTLSQRRGLDQRRLTQLLRGELDWIVMKALEKDRNRRYESASSLAADIERYLTDEPVQAGPPSAVYRFRKLVQRNRVALTTVALVSAALVVGTAFSTWQAVRAQRALHLADERYKALTQAQLHATGESQRATTAESDAAERYRVAKETVDAFLLRVTGDERLKQPAFRDLRKKLLESALPLLERLSVRATANGSSEFSRGEAFIQLANVRQELGEFDPALRHWQDATEIFDRLLAAAPADVQARGKLAHVLVGSAAHHRLRSGDRAITLPLERRALEMRKQLANEQPHSDGAQHELAMSLNNVAMDGAAASENRTLLKEAMQIWEQLVNRQASNVGYRENLSLCYHNWGYSLSWSKQAAEGLQFHEKALQIREQLRREQPASPAAHLQCAQSHHHLANAYTDDLKQLATAHEHRQQSVEIIRDFLQQHPQWPSAKSQLAIYCDELAMLQKKMGRLDEAEETSRTGIQIKEALAAEFPEVVQYQVDLAGTESNFGSLLCQRGNFEPGIELLNSARRRLTRVLEITGGHAKAREFWRITLSDLARVHTYRSNTLIAQGDAVATLANLLTARDVRQELAASDPGNVGYTTELGGSQCNLGNCHFRAGQHEQAIEWYSQAIDTLEPLATRAPKLPPARRYLVNSYRGRSSAQVQLKRYNAAYADIRKAIDFDDAGLLELKLQQVAIRTQISPEGAILEIEELLSSEPTGEKYFQAAMIHALAAENALAANSDTHFRRAVELLQSAHESGYFQKPEQLVVLDQQFETFNGREDYAKLRAAVQAAVQATVKSP